MEANQTTRGVIHTFYSFKGGVGRSMALANVAALLARWGKRVLIVDWDLEAPGIDKFFERWTSESRRTTAGLVDLICNFSDGTPSDWRNCLLKVALPDRATPLHILSAGRDDPQQNENGYSANLLRINWEVLFREKRFGAYLELLRQEWTANYDFVLIDSRTGITDIGGICTIHLPDVLICLFTTTEQSLGGVKSVMRRARKAHGELPVDRRQLQIVPLPARDESRTEYKLATEWRRRFAAELDEFVKDWAPKGESTESILDLLKVPYVAYWSFGERLPVLDEDVENPDKLAYFYKLVARLVLSHLDLTEVKTGTRSAQAAEEAQAEAAERTKAAEAARHQAMEAAEERAFVKQRQMLRERSEQYERFVNLRLLPALSGLRNRAFVLAGTSAAIELFGAICRLQPQDVARVLHISDAFLLSLVFVTGGVVIAFIAWLYFRRVDRLLGERALFDGQAGPYADKDLSALRSFIERVEVLLRAPLWHNFGTVIARARTEDAVIIQQSFVETPSAQAVGAHHSTELAQRYDVFFSYRHDPTASSWLHRHFLPLFTSWLTDELGREVNVFVADKVIGGRSTDELGHEVHVFVPDEGVEGGSTIGLALARSSCLLALVTPAYFQSSSCEQEWKAFESTHPERIVPLLWRGSPERLRANLLSTQFYDLREFAIVGDAFQKTEGYVDFQKQVRRIVERTASIVSSASEVIGEGAD